MSMETIASRVKALRVGLRMSQVELARRCEVSQPTIANIERGRTTEIKGYVLERMARELNTTPGYILEGAVDVDGHESNMMQAELMSIFRKLPAEDQDALLRSARGMYALRATKASSIHPFPSREKHKQD